MPNTQKLSPPRHSEMGGRSVLAEWRWLLGRAMEKPQASIGISPSADRVQPAAKSKAAARTSGKRPTWRDWKEIAKRVFKALGDDRLIAVAAGIVFYGLLAFFPAITALVSIYGLVADPSTIREHMSLASGILPAGGFDIMREQVERILAKGGGQLSFAFVFGISLAIWSANAGMKAMMDALNVIYNVPETAQFHPAQRGVFGAHRRRVSPCCWWRSAASCYFPCCCRCSAWAA